MLAKCCQAPPAELVKANPLELVETNLHCIILHGDAFQRIHLLGDIGNLHLEGHIESICRVLEAHAAPDSWLVGQRKLALRFLLDALHKPHKIQGEHHATCMTQVDDLMALIVDGDGDIILVPECDSPPEGF